MFDVRRLVFALRGGLLALCIALTASCGGGGGGGTTDTTPPPSGGSSTTAPAVPSSLQGTAGNAQVALTWSASTGATSYNVKRSTTSGGPYTQLQTSTSASYTDTGLTNGTTYYYVVSSVNSAGESANSGQASATPAAPAAPPTSAPPAPTGVTATPGDAQISLGWAASAGVAYYNVKRSPASGGPYTTLKQPTVAAYLDTSLTNGLTYYYVISAVNSIGESANSTEVSAIPVLTNSNPPPTVFGTWINVTPSNANLTSQLSCDNYGVESVQVDPNNPANLYAQFHCQGIWKSTDYGATWNGPINTGTNGATVSDCAGGISIPPHSAASTPIIYQSCIRGTGAGFWRSLDGGVNWTNYVITPTASINRPDYYPPVVDPYDDSHLLMAGHEMNYIVQSVDGGQNWTNVSMASGMMENGGTGELFFIDTGASVTTRGTWLWIAQGSGGLFGTWRTSDGGTTWTQVDKNEHPHGASQIYQPDAGGTVYMAGLYSSLGFGVLRSKDYGQTWGHVGTATNQTGVIGTSKNVYSMYGWSIGRGMTVSPLSFQVSSQPGTGTWVQPGTPAGLTQGAHEIRAVNDGTHNVLVGAMGNAGLWRFVEP